MTTCPTCGTQQKDAARFCRTCGTAIGATTVTNPLPAAKAAAAAAVPPPGPSAPTTPPPAGGSKRTTTVLVVAVIALALSAVTLAVVLATGGDDLEAAAPTTTATPTDDTAPTDTEAERATEASAVEAPPATTAPLSTEELPRAQVLGSTSPIEGIAAVTASSTADPGQEADGSAVSYAADQVNDGRPETAWRTPGDGSGERLVFRLPGRARIVQVGLIPGYAKTDPSDGTDRFTQNRRVLEVRWHLGNGQVETQVLGDNRRLQPIPVDVTTQRIELEIVSTRAPSSSDPRDYTPISEVLINGVFLDHFE